ncbi:MAG: serine protease, partial [Halobacteriales archaeon]|nr:serine protease [Halobacteriales archaeon]
MWRKLVALVAMSLVMSGLAPGAASAEGDEPQGDVYLGDPAPEDSYPFNVRLEYTNGSQFCSGSLIANYWVMTAAHCADDPASNVIARVGSHTSTTGGTTHRGAAWLVHPSYNNSTFANDIALLRIQTPSFAAPARLPASSDSYSFYRSIGWGNTTSGSTTNATSLQWVNQTLDTIVSSTIRAYRPTGSGALCPGDSGGPVLGLRSSGWTVVGVHSTTTLAADRTCSTSNPTVNAMHVLAYLNWINGHLDDNDWHDSSTLLSNALPGVQGSIDFSNASDEGTWETDGCNTGRTRWYHWTAPAAMRVRASTSGPEDTVLGVFTPRATGSPTRIMCNDDVGPGD